MTTIPNDHIYGLGSGPKADVLAQLLAKKIQQQQEQQQQESVVAMMVEDNLSTLHKIVANPQLLQGRVLPVLASWGYNTLEQQQEARNKDHFVVLDSEDSLSRVLDSKLVPTLWKEFFEHGKTY